MKEANQIRILCCFLAITTFTSFVRGSDTGIETNVSQTFDLNARECTDGYCSYHGRCNDEKTECICDKGYITFKSSDGKQCNYKQKSTLVAFLLEFFLGAEAGAGYLYLGQNGLGVGQLILFWLGIIPVCFIMCCGLLASDRRNGDTCAMILAALGCLYMLGLGIGIIAWWIYALVTIAQGNVVDGNGAPIPQL